HLAYDTKRGRLIVAELGNNSVSILDPDQRTIVHRIAGLNLPQGVAYLAPTDTIYVASAGDGSVQRYKAADVAATGRTDLSDDADNIRIDRATSKIFVGYGGGGLAVLDGLPTSTPSPKSDAETRGLRGFLSGDKSGKLRGGKIKGTSALYLLPVHPEG